MEFAMDPELQHVRFADLCEQSTLPMAPALVPLAPELPGFGSGDRGSCQWPRQPCKPNQAHRLQPIPPDGICDRSTELTNSDCNTNSSHFQQHADSLIPADDRSSNGGAPNPTDQLVGRMDQLCSEHLDERDRLNLLFYLNEFETNACDLSELLANLIQNLFVKLADPAVKCKLLAYIRAIYVEPKLAHTSSKPEVEPDAAELSAADSSANLSHLELIQSGALANQEPSAELPDDLEASPRSLGGLSSVDLKLLDAMIRRYSLAGEMSTYRRQLLAEATDSQLADCLLVANERRWRRQLRAQQLRGRHSDYQAPWQVPLAPCEPAAADWSPLRAPAGPALGWPAQMAAPPPPPQVECSQRLSVYSPDEAGELVSPARTCACPSCRADQPAGRCRCSCCCALTAPQVARSCPQQPLAAPVPPQHSQGSAERPQRRHRHHHHHHHNHQGQQQQKYGFSDGGDKQQQQQPARQQRHKTLRFTETCDTPQGVSLIPAQARARLPGQLIEQMTERASSFVRQQALEGHSGANSRKSTCPTRFLQRVRLRKCKPVLGIAIEGGANVGGQSTPRVVCVHEGGAAYQSGLVQTKDLIMEVNGKSTVNMTHEEIAETIASAYYSDQSSHIELLLAKEANSISDS